MQSENLAYDWNDVALLTDQRACTFLCKTMLLVSDMEVCQLQEIHLVNWEKTLPQEDKKQLSGVMQVQIVYLDQKGKQCQLQTEIPLQGTLAMPVQALGQAKLLYGRGQVADGYLLLETVLQIPYELQLQRSQVIVGPFEMEELIARINALLRRNTGYGTFGLTFGDIELYRSIDNGSCCRTADLFDTATAAASGGKLSIYHCVCRSDPTGRKFICLSAAAAYGSVVHCASWPTGVGRCAAVLSEFIRTVVGWPSYSANRKRCSVHLASRTCVGRFCRAMA